MLSGVLHSLRGYKRINWNKLEDQHDHYKAAPGDVQLRSSLLFVLKTPIIDLQIYICYPVSLQSTGFSDYLDLRCHPLSHQVYLASCILSYFLLHKISHLLETVPKNDMQGWSSEGVPGILTLLLCGPGMQ